MSIEKENFNAMIKRMTIRRLKEQNPDNYSWNLLTDKELQKTKEEVIQKWDKNKL